MSNSVAQHPTSTDVDGILELARGSGLLITLDGQIGREKYQSVAGSLTSFMRFVDALRQTFAADMVV